MSDNFILNLLNLLQLHSQCIILVGFDYWVVGLMWRALISCIDDLRKWEWENENFSSLIVPESVELTVRFYFGKKEVKNT